MFTLELPVVVCGGRTLVEGVNRRRQLGSFCRRGRWR